MPLLLETFLFKLEDNTWDLNHGLLCISTNKRMLEHAFAWSKTIKNNRKCAREAHSCKTHEEKYFFHNFQMFFIIFDHGRKTQQWTSPLFKSCRFVQLLNGPLFRPPFQLGTLFGCYSNGGLNSGHFRCPVAIKGV